MPYIESFGIESSVFNNFLKSWNIKRKPQWLSEETSVSARASSRGISLNLQADFANTISINYYRHRPMHIYAWRTHRPSSYRDRRTSVSQIKHSTLESPSFDRFTMIHAKPLSIKLFASRSFVIRGSHDNAIGNVPLCTASVLKNIFPSTFFSSTLFSLFERIFCLYENEVTKNQRRFHWDYI